MLASASSIRQLKAIKSQVPALGELCKHQKRHESSSHYDTYGAGGRNSFNGVVATVFGATGFLGRYVVNRLARAGTQIVIPYRGVEDDVRHLRVMGELGQIVFLNYDLKDKDSILKTMTHSNTVVNLVGRTYPTRNFSMEDCMITGAKSIAEAASQSGINQLIHVSALNAAGASPSKFLQIKAYETRNIDYIKPLNSQGERAVMEEFSKATIVRPAQYYGHEDRYFNNYAYLRKLPLGVPLVNNGYSTTKRPVHVSDVAQAIVAATKDPTNTVGKTYELYGPEEYYLHDIVEFIFKMIRKPFRPINIPMFANKLVGFMGEQTLFAPKITRDIVIRQYLNDNVSDEAFTFEDLGLTPSNINDAALSVLRRHRDYYHYDQLIEEGDFCKPVSAYQ